MQSFYSNPNKSAFFIILFFSITGAIYNQFIPLHGDEAYYWVWSHHLQGGYLDHPPMIAFLIALSNLFSESEFGIRLVNIVSIAVASIYLYKTAVLHSNSKIALNALLIFYSILTTHVGQIITTPDSPLIMFWSMCLFYTLKALKYDQLKDFVLAGISLGLLCLSKYTAILFIISMVIFLAIKRPTLFKDKRFYLATLLALIVITPLLMWNYQNDWISFKFQSNQHAEPSSHLLWGNVKEFFFGQFLAFSVIFFAVYLITLIKNKLFYNDSALFFLALNSLFVIVFFLYKSLTGYMELNYAAPAYIAAAILVAWQFNQWQSTRWFIAGLIVAFLISFSFRYAMAFHLNVVQDRMYGNKQAIERLAHYYNPEKDAVYANHLTIAALTNYYLKNHPYVDVPIRSRISQYDLWRSNKPFKPGLFITIKDNEAELKKVFSSVKLLDTMSFEIAHNEIKTYKIYRVD